MGPNNESLQLPEPMEQAPSGGAPAEQAPVGAERAAAPERGNQAGSAAPPSLPVIPPPTADPVSLPGMPAASSNPAASQANPTQARDDADIIEKEWVTKAKQIVERTRDDPYKQSEELNVFKADYMKKRYNRTIKVSK